MKKSVKYAIIAICCAVTFIIPLLQLSIGFYFLVDDGENPNEKCSAAPDLPILLAMGGISCLIFFGMAYGLLKLIASITNIKSSMQGIGPQILLGLISFIFGALTLTFFILIQMRIYGAYSNNVQSRYPLMKNYCRLTLIRGSLSMVILTYANIIFFLIVVILICTNVRKKIKHQKEIDIEMVPTHHIDRL